MKKLLFALSFCYSVMSFAQVGVGTTMPDASAQLDVDAADKGILIPRLDIGDLNTAAPVAVADIDISLLAYNINANSGKGYYYWSGAKWTPISGITTGNGVPTTTNPANPVAGDIYVDESTGDIYIHDGNTWVVNQSKETLTKIEKNADGKNLDYTDEKGDVTQVDVSSMVTANETLTKIEKNADGKNLDYTDEKGDVTQVDVSSMVTANET